MEWQIVSAALAFALVAREVQRALENRAQRQHVERLERMVAARSMADFAAAEKILARPEKATRAASPGPSLYDEMFGVTTSKKGS